MTRCTCRVYFKWYKKEFPDNIYGYLQRYEDPGLAHQLRAAKDYSYRIRYQPFDWSLNDCDDEENTNDDGH